LLSLRVGQPARKLQFRLSVKRAWCRNKLRTCQ